MLCPPHTLFEANTGEAGTKQTQIAIFFFLVAAPFGLHANTGCRVASAELAELWGSFW
jgi:hypothetical protein